MLKDEKILITGPTSQVAFPIARELAKSNDVYGLARFRYAGDRERLEAVGVRCLQMDLAEDSFVSVPDDFTYVLHFAVVKTSDFDSDLAANAEGPGRLMYHCRKAKAWLHCSSGGVYQHAGHHPLKETDPLGDNHRAFLPTYSICKIAGETVARFAARQWNVPCTIARLSVPYGDNGGWPAMHLDWMLANSSVPATVINWGGSEPVSIEEWCTYMGHVVDRTPQFLYTDYTIGSITLDLTRMHQYLTRTKVDWRDGMCRMIRARHPELGLGN
jgi:UDP-glucuronate 4-epimerase